MADVSVLLRSFDEQLETIGIDAIEWELSLKLGIPIEFIELSWRNGRIVIIIFFGIIQILSLLTDTSFLIS